MERVKQPHHLKQSLKRYGLNPEQWDLLVPPLAEPSWVILRHRYDQNYQWKGRTRGQGIDELELISL